MPNLERGGIHQTMSTERQTAPERRAQITTNGVLYQKEVPGPLLGENRTTANVPAALLEQSLVGAAAESRGKLKAALRGRPQA